MRRRLIASLTVAAIALTTASGAGVNAASPAAPGDFNGDGIIDLAIGVPGDTITGHTRAGAVAIARGRSGTTPAGWIMINQDVGDVPGAAEPDELFGQVLASGDFNTDGRADLAIGIPQEAIGTVRAAGGVITCYGSTNGLSTTGCQSITQDTGTVFTGAEIDDHFGLSLTAGDLTGDGHHDLVIGAPLEGIGASRRDAGAIKIVPGGPNGLDTTKAIDLTQNLRNIPSGTEPDDRFGQGLAVGDIDHDGKQDLIVGTAGEQLAGSSDRGALQLLYGPITSTGPARSQGIYAAEISQTGEFLGETLTTGDFNGDGYDDIAAGMAEQLVAGNGVAGQVAILTGDRTGISPNRVKIIHQGSSGVFSTTEPEDAFGNAIASGDFDGDGLDDLIVGVRSEDADATIASGAAHAFFGHRSAVLNTADSVWIDQEVAGVPDTNATDDHFGWATGAGDIDGDGKTEALISGIGNLTGGVWIIHLDGRAVTSSTYLDQASLGLGTPAAGDFFGQSIAP